jgi:precorrin-6B methylase 2
MSLQIIYETPAQLLLPERVLLYSLVYGLRPTVAVEIGTSEGGAALIICAAMDAAGCGKLVCVDPTPKIAQDNWLRLAHRAVLLEGPSPEALSQVSELVGGQFDFVFIDGDHSYEAVLRDVEATIQFLRPTGYLLLHDAHFTDVREAIDEALRRSPRDLIDCGLLSVEPSLTEDFYKEKPIVWGGLRLLRFSPAGHGARDEEESRKLIARVESQQAYIGQLEQVRDQLWAEVQRGGQVWQEQQRYIEQLEGERQRLWAEVQRGGQAWHEQQRYIASLQTRCEELTAPRECNGGFPRRAADGIAQSDYELGGRLVNRVRQTWLARQVLRSPRLKGALKKALGDGRAS